MCRGDRCVSRTSHVQRIQACVRSSVRDSGQLPVHALLSRWTFLRRRNEPEGTVRRARYRCPVGNLWGSLLHKIQYEERTVGVDHGSAEGESLIDVNETDLCRTIVGGTDPSSK